MRKRRVQLLLVILIGLTAILLGDHLLSGGVGEGPAPAKSAVVGPLRAAPAREASGLPNSTKLAAFPADPLNAGFESRSITNQKSPITNLLIQNPKPKIQNGYGRLPLSFEANHGQTDPQVRFLARGGGYTIFLTADEAVLTLRKSQPGMSPLGKFGLPGRLEPFGPIDPRAGRWPSLASDWKSLWPSLIPALSQLVPEPNAGKGGVAAGVESQPPQVVRMRLVGGNANARVVGLDELPGRSNYFIGNDPKKWRTNVPSYARVKHEGVYPGVDLVYYGNQRQLEYDFVAAPGGDPNQIKLSFAGADGMRVDGASGDLVLKAGDDELRFRKPVVYQPPVAAVSSSPSNPVAAVYDRRRRSESAATAELDGAFVMASNNQVAFRVAGYDPKRALVIDPVLSYSTYLGGSSTDAGEGIAVDATGDAYVTGFTSSTDFPTVNPLQATNNAINGTAFVAKLNAAGSALVYSTYLGGGSRDLGFGIGVDSPGNAYVTGYTTSTDFPTVNPLQATNNAINGTAFVTKLNAAGSALVYSTYLGGSNTDSGAGIAVDSSGNAYVTGETSSTDFPTANPLQATYEGNGDAFVAKLNPAGSALVYSTYLGGSGGDQGNGIAVDSSSNAYVTGLTDSSDFPTVNPLQATDHAYPYSNAFVAKLNAAGSALVYSTYLGGSGEDYDSGGVGIAVDSSGDAYVTGGTTSTDFPTANPLQATYGGGLYDAFVAKLNAAGSALVYSTYLGGSGEDYGVGITVDSSGNAYVTGETESTDFPTVNALQATCGDCGLNIRAPFVAKLNAAGSALVYSTYLGGGAPGIGGSGIAVDSSGNAYVTGCSSTGFPTVNPLQATYGGGLADAFVAKISPAPVVTLSAKSLSFASQIVSTTSGEQSVTLTNSGDGLLSITAITVSGDFALATTATSCPYGGGSMASQANCTINVTFSPTATGTRTGTVTVTDNAAGSPQSVVLSGTGTGPVVNLGSSSLTFSAQMSGTSSSAQPVTLTNTGNAPLTISSITASGDFSQTNTCGSSVSAGANCTISVTFKPMAGGTQTGSISISDNGPNSPQTIALSGTGQDFSLGPPSGSSTSATAAPGQAATYTLSVGGEGGLSGTVTFTCTGAPSEATCTVSPNPLTVGSSATNVTVTVTTTASSVSAPRSRPLPPVPPLSPGLRYLLMLVLALAAMACAIGRQNQPGVSRWQSTMVPLAAGLLLTLALAGCGGGGGSASITSNPGTPAGTYTLTVTGSTGSGSSALSHSVTLTLNVS
jgi:hypothetical protein